MYLCDNDFVLFLRILNALQIFMAAVLVAWSRHEPPEEVTEYVMGAPVVRVIHTDNVYSQTTIYHDLIPTNEQEVLRQMILAGESITFRSAQAHGITRAAWNKTRDSMVKMRLAEMTDGGRLVLNLAAYHFLGVGKPAPRDGNTNESSENDG